MSPQITLHHLNLSRSDRIFWALEELQLPYDVKVYFRLPSRGAPPSLKEISPFGKAPVLQLDGETLTESAYIIHRLLKLAPEDHAEVETRPSDDSIFWAHFSEGSQMNLFQAQAFISASGAGFQHGLMGDLGEEEKKGVGKYVHWLTDTYLRTQNQTNLDQVEAFLAKNQYFSGNDKPGLGDFMMFFIYNSLLAGFRKDSPYNIGPASQKWFERINQRPALQKAKKRLEDEESAAKAKI